MDKQRGAGLFPSPAQQEAQISEIIAPARQLVGFIPAMPRDTLWVGRDLSTKMLTYVKLSPTGEVEKILSGNNIISGFSDEKISIKPDTITIYTDPLASNTHDSKILFETEHNIGEYESHRLIAVSENTKWRAYILSGKSGTMTILRRTKRGEEETSFTTNGTAYSRNNIIFVQEEDRFFILTETGKHEIHGHITDVKVEYQEEALTISGHIDGTKKIITMRSGIWEIADDTGDQTTTAE